MNVITSQAIAHALTAHPRCDSWTLRLDKLSFPDDATGSWKKPALDTAVREFKVATHSTRWIDQLKTQHGERFRELRMVNTSRLAVALGHASVLENVGLAANRITGLPLIPGSAVKGLVSMWACWRGNAPSGDQDDQVAQFRDDFATERRALLPHTSDLATQILGSDDSNDADAGDIVFFGAFSVVDGRLKLEVDVLTPHTSGEPKPSFFLAIASGATWHFVLLASRRTEDRSQTLLDTATAWLREALTQIGIGAKTAAGYGRFVTEDAFVAAQQPPQPSSRPAAPHPPPTPIPRGDYTEATFKNAVLRTAQNRGNWGLLQKELVKLLKPENAAWLQNFKTATQGKEFKALRQQPWYPK